MSQSLALSTFFIITIALNFPSALLFSRSRQNSRFSKDFDPSSSDSDSSAQSSTSSLLADSNESSGAIIIDETDTTGSQNATHHNGKLVHHEDEGLRGILCPENNLLMRYDLRAGKCGEIDTQAHCGTNMIFKEEIDSSSYGYCECDFESHEIPLVFHLPTNTCHPVYSQGYCSNPGDWLILSKEAKGPVCQKNQCSSASNAALILPPKGLPTNSRRRTNRRRSSKLIFPWIWGEKSISSSSNSGHDPVIKIKDNTRKSTLHSIPSSRFLLVPLNGSGPCVPLGMGSTKFCSNDMEKVIFSQGDIVARCGVPGRSFRRLSIIPNACPPGSYYSIIGYCQPVWDF